MGSKPRVPGAVIVKNNHRHEFYLKTLTVEGLAIKGGLHFACNSWIYPAGKYSYDRVFFVNNTYLPSKTPKALRAYREDELRVLRGNGSYGKLEVHDRVYDYDVYNDLGDASKGKEYERPVLGGSRDTPYPRRTRSGRPLIKGDYIPCDEYFCHIKYADFIAFKLKSDMTSSIKEKGDEEFFSFDDIMKLYQSPMKFPSILSKIRDWIPSEIIKELLRTDGERLMSFPLPQVISQDDDKSSWWASDKEFARQMLAGLHPVLIRAAKDNEVKEFMKNNNSNPKHSSCQMKSDEDNEDDIDEWVIVIPSSTKEDEDKEGRYFILDHTYLKDYMDKIREVAGTNVYASKTLLYLEKDGTLSPRGIMLMEKIGDEHYFSPCEHGIDGALWKLAKAFVLVNDSGYHQLVSHWLYTHAVIEPFIIATNRQLSVMHPIYKLLIPHCRDTINMNSLARQILIHANGAIERNFFTGKYALSLTSEIYKGWNLMDHALPTDLLKRGVAVQNGDKSLRLLIEDYPYAVDGLEIWSAIEIWVASYCSIYYPDDQTVQSDTELQAWWKETREVGHGDLKDQPWWPKMQTLKTLTECCTIIIWLASAFHAALNFGQYAYSGFVPNRPTFIRRSMPVPEEYEEVIRDPDGFFLKTITSKSQALSVMAVIEILSRHSSDEVYLGQREDQEWTSDRNAREMFKRFHDELMRIEKRIEMRNQDEKLKNRHGMVKVPYTLLYPNTSDCDRVAGLTGKGIPNSISV